MRIITFCLASLLTLLWMMPAGAVVSADVYSPLIYTPPQSFSGGDIADTVDALTDGTPGMTDDSVSGDLDITAVLSDETIGSNVDVEVRLELIGGATFTAAPVMGDLWDGDSSISFGQFLGAAGLSTVVYRGTSEDGLGTTNTLAVDVRGITVIDESPIDLRITVKWADNFGDNIVRSVRMPYVRFVGNSPIDLDSVLEPLIYAAEVEGSQLSDSVDGITDGTGTSTDDTVQGVMDLTGELSASVPEDVDLNIRVTLSDNAVFTQTARMGDLWDGDSSQFFVHTTGGASLNYSTFTADSGDGFDADSQFALDMRGITVSDQDDVFLTILIETDDGTTVTRIREDVVPYVRFRDLIELTANPNRTADRIDAAQESLYFDGAIADTSVEVGTIEIIGRERLNPDGSWKLDISDVLESISFMIEGPAGLDAFSQSGGSIVVGSDSASIEGTVATVSGLYPLPASSAVTFNVPMNNAQEIGETGLDLTVSGVARSGFTTETIALSRALSSIGPPDADDDGVAQSIDNCPSHANGDQADQDGDGIGDDCDSDQDGDGVADAADNCPTVPNADQAPSDEIDGVGSACDTDTDGDGVYDVDDLFVADATEWSDADGDGIGDNADPDAETSANVYLMTTSTSLNISSLHIINTASTPQSFHGTLYNREGDRLGEMQTPLHERIIEPQARLILDSSELESLFSTMPWQGPALLEVSGTADFELMTKLVSPSGLVSNTNCVTENVVHNVEGSDSDAQTYIRLINTGDTLIDNIRGELRDSVGNRIGSPGVIIRSRLLAKEAVFLSRADLEGLFGSWSGDASLEITSSASDLKLLNLNFVNDETFFNFSCFESSDSARVYLMTTSQSNNVSETHLINTSESPVTLTGSLYQRDGTQLGSTDVSLGDAAIAPRGRLIISATDLESRFDVLPWVGPALLETAGADNLALMTKLTSPSGLVSNTNCVRSGDVHNIEGSESSVVTYVRFINQGDEAISGLTGTLYDSNGAILGAEHSALLSELGSKQAAWLTRSDLAEIFGDWEGEASLLVDADDLPDLKLLNLNFVNGETFFNFSCYEQAR